MSDDPLPQSAGQDAPLVTIVVSFRERWRFTARTIEGIINNTPGQFGILLLDSGMPQNVRDEVQPHHDSGAIEIVDVGRGTLPNHGRAIVAERLKSKYAVFIDNDIIVM